MFTKQRKAFTLIEILMVMAIIGVLIALLVPAISAAIRTARSATVTADINSLATALAQFKSTYSDYPPSRVLLNESGNYSTTSTTSVASWFTDTRTDVTVGQLSARSVRYMSKFFPRAVSFSTTGGTPFDYNGNGTTTDFFYLSGDECLVFFLGGITSTPLQSAPVGSPIGMIGFSRNPAFPCDRTSTSRTQPFYEFRGDRLVDPDGDGFPSLLDTLGGQGRYYCYFSAYGNNGYDPNDCNGVQYEPFQGGPLSDPVAVSLGDVFSRAFEVSYPVTPNGFTTGLYRPATNICVSPAPNPYTSSGSPGGVNDFSPNLNPNVVVPVSFQNPNTFQVISAGLDQIYGVGGQFSTASNTSNQIPTPLVEIKPPPQGLGLPWTGGLQGGPAIDFMRFPESDNLSNFSNTRMNQ